MSTLIDLELLPAGGGCSLAVATLNAPATLNALSLPMVRALTDALRTWASAPAVAAVLLRGSGGKAFCAGGDLRELYDSMRNHGGQPNAYAEAFFGEEYRLDYLIHSYPKPLVCWGSGIVMGGGIGLMSGASHRLVTETSKLAMPEIGIGLYPDVGGSWILRHMPGRIGLFLALTGAPLNAADALFCGLADTAVAAGDLDAILAALRGYNYQEEPSAKHVTLGEVLAAFPEPVLAPSRLRQHFDLIERLMAGDDLGRIAARLRALETDDPWLAAAGESFCRGSPTSVALAFALWQRAKHRSLADVFRMEYQASLGCAAHHDFAEGIRALMIDKDRSPRWQPAELEAVTPALIEEHLRPRFPGPHPLADLGADGADGADTV